MIRRIPFLAIVTRRALSDYLSGVALMLFVLLLVAYTIDLAEQFASIRAEAQAQDRWLIAILLPYLGQRGVDIASRMLPVAIFFGTFLAEIFRRQRLESVILATAGASPLRSYAALLWLGVIVGAGFWAVDSQLRPVVVAAQVDSGIGTYADRYRRGWERNAWLIAGDIAIRGDILRADGPHIENVLVFRGIRSDELTEILAADRMDPTGTPSRWALTGVTRFDTVRGTKPVPFPDMVLDFEMIPQQLTYRGYSDLFLPNSVLKALVAMPVPPDNLAAAQTEQWRRATVWLLPGVIAFLAVGMANLGFEGRRILVARLIALAVVGYWYVTAIKVVANMGSLELVAPWISVIAPLAVSLALAGWLAWRQA